MALNSSTVSSGELATATQFNNLRADVVSTASGHVHDGSLGIGSAQFILGVAGAPLLLQNTTDAASNQGLRIGGGNRSTPADNDEVYTSFMLDDNAGTQTEFVRLTAKALDVTNCSKDSRPELQYYTSNTLRELVFPAITANDTVAVLGLAQTFTATQTYAGITLSGALDANGTVDADVTDFDVVSTGDIDLISSANTACAVYIAQNSGAGTSGTIKIHADTGAGEGSITLTSDAGGIDLNAAAGKDIALDAGQVLVTATHDTACTIYLRANGGTSETIKIHADQGTGEGAITLTSDAGGIDLNAAAGKDIDLAGGQINLTGSHNTACTIYLRANAGTSETIKIHSDLGSAEGSITLTSDAGGIDLNAHAAKDITLDSGQVLVTATHNTACTIYLHADGGSSETIKIHADQGTSESSIQLLSDAGGVDINAATGKDVDVAGGTINLTSSDNAGSAIYLRANAGTSETIKIHADQGSGTGSICLTSDAGGITLNPGTFVSVGGIADAELRLFEDTGAGTNYAAIKVQNMGASYTLTLPADDGCCGEFLKTNGSGVLDWAAGSAGTDTSVKVKHSAAQSIACGAMTLLVWDQEVYDCSAMHGACTSCPCTNAAHYSRLKAVSDGVYVVNALLQFCSNSTGNRWSQMLVNNTVVQEFNQKADQATAHWFNINNTIKLSTNDYVTLKVQQNRGGCAALNLHGNGNVSQGWFAMTKVLG
jgi:hypothetical protein